MPICNRPQITIALTLLATSLSLLNGSVANAHQLDSQGQMQAVDHQINDMTVLNNHFRAIYMKARDTVQNPDTPVIICFSDRMKLLSKSKTDEINFLPPSYTTLKIVDHIPLAIFTLLVNTASNNNNNAEASVSKETLEQLVTLKNLIEKARPEIADLGYSAEVLARQQLIVDESLKFIAAVTKNEKVSSAQLDQFDASLRQAVLANAYEAVSAQLATQDERIAQWKKELGPAWKNLKVVIVSGHMPRKQHSSFQLFSKILGVKEEGDQIVYSESAADEKEALVQLHTHMLDKKVGESFFNDSWRMHRDLLADGAAKYLKTHKLKSQD